MDNLFDYTLYDDNGDMYVTKLSQREIEIHNLDHHKRFRLLNFLKRQQNAATVPSQPQPSQSDPPSRQPPCQQSGQHLVATSSSSTHSASVPRAQGKKGAVWKGKTPEKMLNCCLPYRKWLRLKPVPDQVWQCVSDDMFYQKSLDYSWEQIKEKIRNLKRTFKEAKEGQHGGTDWDQYWLMTYIYDDPITGLPGDTTLCPAGFDLLQQQQQQPGPNLMGVELQQQQLGPNVMGVEPLQQQPAGPNVGEQIGGQASNSECHQHWEDGSDDIAQRVLDFFNSEDNQQHPETSFNLDKPNNDDVFASCNESAKQPDCEEILDVVSTLNLDNGNINNIGSPGFSSTVLEATVSDPVINYTDKLATPVQQPAKECTDQSASDKQQRIIKSVTSACLLNSPARKKNKGTASFSIHSPSPVKTPKRKQSKASLQWDSEDTTSFVDILVAHKDDLVLPQIPLSTWKEISLALRDITVIKSWQNCRDKFHQMNAFFVGTVLPTGGLLGVKKWPYYTKFCIIFDIPEDYHELVLEENFDVLNNGQDSQAGGRLWTRDKVLLLIALYKAKMPMFKASKSCLRHNVLWAQISQEMKTFDVNITWKQCKDHFATLKKKLHEEHLSCNNTGAAPSTWEFYNDMLELFEGGPTLNAPHSVTVGLGLTCRANGEVEEETKRTTRTRKNTNPQQKQQVKARKPLYKSWAVEMHEKQFEQREKIYNEVHLLRTNNEKTAVERREVFRKINARLDQLKNVIGQSNVSDDDDGIQKLPLED